MAANITNPHAMIFVKKFLKFGMVGRLMKITAIIIM